ncbi:MAG: hypothetical protein KAW17_02855 [Candidatus Eisenbacteria sp.]|nr:hypothetical protein [Candidatus Eisenbacteria bacterium]
MSPRVTTNVQTIANVARRQRQPAGSWYVDNITIQVNEATAADETSWGGVKAMYR